MTELLIILLIITIAFLFAFRRPSSSVPVSIPEENYKKAPIIEDNSHLKSELAEVKQNYSFALQQMGQLQRDVQQLNSQLSSVSAAKKAGDEAFQKLQHQNKSSQVRTGAIGESLLPLHEDFPCNPKTLRLLGSPVDYVSFCYDTNMISFVEVKTGESQLNDNQRKVKKMVEEGRVQFKVVRLNEKGVKVK